ncbi:uncharacterized protein TNCT_325681 [Trichonephila clavata]|uniref:Uncharacterized protein n=1 Tax=Trichonephila clavata TaxID=2740835 RepID=A0A8X6J2A2_TRICU|nr:uncharacterized protein TNCT_325681 [Trichonephila clavata]
MHAADDFLDPLLKDRGHLWLTLAGLSAHPKSIKPQCFLLVTSTFLAWSLRGKWERVIRHSLMKNLIRASPGLSNGLFLCFFSFPIQLHVISTAVLDDCWKHCLRLYMENISRDNK